MVIGREVTMFYFTRLQIMVLQNLLNNNLEVKNAKPN
nr:MAG TPA: hypothetical protein [Caudoviricetes sp.]